MECVKPVENLCVPKKTTYLRLTKPIFFNIIVSMQPTYNPKVKKRKRVHGFLKRMLTRTGKAVLARRRLKGRKKLTV